MYTGYCNFVKFSAPFFLRYNTNMANPMCDIFFQSALKIHSSQNQSVKFIICLLSILMCDREVKTFLGSSFQNSHLHNSSPSDMYRMSCVPFYWPSWCLVRPLITKNLLHHQHFTWRSVFLVFGAWWIQRSKWKEDWAYCKTYIRNVDWSQLDYSSEIGQVLKVEAHFFLKISF